MEQADFGDFVASRDLPPLRERLLRLEQEHGITEVHRRFSDKVLAAGARLMETPRYIGMQRCFALSPDGRHLAIASNRLDESHGGDATEKAMMIFGAVIAVASSGRLIIRPLFRFAAKVKLREAFTAIALLIVVAAAALMHKVGLSPALGAFLAGVVLADSEYRHQIEADIEPFKGLLLGLFFITIGSQIQFEFILKQPGVIAGWALAILGIKSLLIYGLGRSFRMRPPESLLFASSLAMGGEFAFVLITHAHAILPEDLSQALMAAVAITMALSPLLIKLTIQKGMSRLECITPEVREPDQVDESEKDNPVLIIGVGRFGQTLIRFLRANQIRSTVLDLDSEQSELMGRFGIKSYFGDGTNLDLLRAAGLSRAQALVVAIDEPESTIKIVE
ncbi:hypothetical protein EON80_29125, partial [bacterium]